MASFTTSLSVYSSDTGRSQSQSTFSSKTEGSRSGHSVTEGKPVRDEDFTMDNSVSPVDLECSIQAERITKILDETLNKIKVAVCLNYLVQNELLKKELDNQSYEEVMFIYEQYDSSMSSLSLLNISAVEDIKAGDMSIKNRLCPEQGHLIYVLNSNPAVKSIVDNIINKMRQNSSAENKLEKPLLDYLLVFERFRELMVRQMCSTAEEDLRAKIRIRNMEVSNAKLKVKIAELKALLTKERAEFEKKLEKRAQIIASLERDFSDQNIDAAHKLHKTILDSERQILLMSRAHEVRYELLQEEEQNSRDSYHNMLRNNMKEEKVQRQRRFKFETQLMSWVQKYDTEMTDKQAGFDDLDAKFEEEKAKVAYLEDELAEQDKKYLPLMAEREAEYAEEMTKKMNNYKREHAARILQTAWRQVLANRKEKKKLKKAVRKIKQAEEKAERLNYLKYLKEQRAEALRKKKEKKEDKEAKKKRK